MCATLVEETQHILEHAYPCGDACAVSAPVGCSQKSDVYTSDVYRPVNVGKDPVDYQQRSTMSLEAFQLVSLCLCTVPVMVTTICSVMPPSTLLSTRCSRMCRMNRRMDRIIFCESYGDDRTRVILLYGHTHTVCKDPTHDGTVPKLHPRRETYSDNYGVTPLHA